MMAAVGIRHTRRLAAAVTFLVAVALVAACGVGPGSRRVTELTFVSYGGVIQDAMIGAWQTPYRAEAPGIAFINTSPPDAGQVRAQVEANAVGWNLVSTPPWLAIQNCGIIYERLDVRGLDQFADDTHGECFVGAFRYSLVFSYNTEKWPDPETAPKTVQDFFDVTAFPGKRGVAATLTDGILEWALLADGVDPANLYPLDVDRALAKWESIRVDTTWTASADQLLDLVMTEQVDMQLLLQPHTLVAVDEDMPIAAVWDATMTSVSGLAIPRGAAYKSEIQQFLSFALESEQQSRLAELCGVEPVNVEAEPTRSVNSNSVNAFGSANTGTTVAVDQDWWSQNWADASTKFTTWLNPPAA